MTGCAAVSCNNSTNKGFRLFRLPTDPVRRAEWLVKMKRDNWKPTRFTALCEAHFDDNAFELNRLDGRKLLKRNAVPTTFFHPVAKSTPKTRKKRIPDTVSETSAQSLKKRRPKKQQSDLKVSSPTNEPTSSDPSTAQKLTKKAPRKLQTGPRKIPYFPVQKLKKKVPGRKPRPRRVFSCLPDNEDALLEDVAQFIECLPNSTVVQAAPPETVLIEPQENLLKEDVGLDQKDQKIKSLQLRVWSLQRQAELLRKSLKRIFSPDQLRHLAAPESTANWSLATIKESLLLQFVIGEKGYEYLYRKGFPIPSKQALKSRMKDVNVQEIKSQSMKEPESVELSRTDSVQQDDPAVNLDDTVSEDQNENVDSFDAVPSLQDSDGSAVSIEGDPIEDCECVISIKPDLVQDCDESVNSLDANKIQILDTGTHTVNPAGVNMVQNSAEAVMRTDTNSVQNSDKILNLYDVVILQNSEQDSSETVNPKDPDIENAGDCLPKSDTVDDLSGMDWEISIEQDVYMCESDQFRKSVPVWETALAALNGL